MELLELLLSDAFPDGMLLAQIGLKIHEADHLHHFDSVTY